MKRSKEIGVFQSYVKTLLEFVQHVGDTFLLGIERDVFSEVFEFILM